MEDTHPFIRKNDFIYKVILVENFLEADDLEEIKGDVIPRDQEWIYNKLAKSVKYLNETKWNFHLCNFSEDMKLLKQRKNEDPWNIFIGPGTESIRKLGILLPKNKVSIELFNGEKIDVQKGSILVFPSFVGWRLVNSLGVHCYITFISGDHFS
jgi:hypothetical protein